MTRIRHENAIAYNEQPHRQVPPIPVNATHFYYSYGYEPATVQAWEWSTTFGKWGASVKFNDGLEVFTYPREETLHVSLFEGNVLPYSAGMAFVEILSHIGGRLVQSGQVVKGRNLESGCLLYLKSEKKGSSAESIWHDRGGTVECKYLNLGDGWKTRSPHDGQWHLLYGVKIEIHATR